MIDTETTKEIRRMAEKGASISRISRELGVSRPTISKCLKDDEEPPKNRHHSESKEGHYPFISKKSIIVDRPSEILKKERETTEIAGLRVEQAKTAKELEEIKGPQISPELQKKKDDLEIKKINLEEFEIEERLKEKRQIEEAQRREEKIKAIIGEVKEQVLPFKMRAAIPAAIIFTIYQRIETELSKFDILNLSHSEVVLIADAVLSESINDPSLQPIIRDSFSEFFFRELRRFLNLGMRQTWEGCFKRGETTLDYRTFILSQISKFPVEKQRKILPLIDV